ncbi:hypothetical protein LQ938_01460 [Microbacterium sp. cx-55]|uniref:hypothetical protein n=1 Tax=Microbacterium sp. cx-55 TaxID=2875948 RepID=UPI001CBC0FDA|nr:hypothetical protein [Microbacterium sp. cx-55]MBZ4487472.1 hypothetical protein [Microbacterium sp. cx-55]UGB35492.1 hypothetical protein LQ938_01460 [Microbacterium sp. cx-55]
MVADPALSVSGYEYVAVNVTTKTQQPNYNKLICGCRIGAANSTCTITGSYTASATVNASLGISAQQVASTLGISVTASVTGSMGCTSPKLSAGTSYKAYVMGTYRYFTLQKWKVSKNGGVTARKLDSTAYNQVAFSPINMIYCTK